MSSRGAIVTQVNAEDRSTVHGPSYIFAELSYLGRNAWWRYALSFALLIAGVIAFTSLGLNVLEFSGKREIVNQAIDDPAFWQNLAITDALITFVFLLSTIIVALIPFTLFVPWIHGRPLSSFVYVRNFNWSGFRISLGAALLVPGFFLLFGLLFSLGEITFQFQAGPWIMFAAVSIVLIPLQVLAEEIVFRGYLLQMIGRRTQLYFVRLLVPAFVFAGLHFANQEVVAGGFWALACYFALSVYLGVLVLWGNGLEYALGLHLGNNLFVALIASSEDSTFGTPTLFKEAGAIWDVTTLMLTIASLGLHFVILTFWRRARSDVPSAG